MKNVLVASFVLLTISLGGCAQLMELAVETAIETQTDENTDIDLDSDDGSLTVKSGDSEFQLQGGEDLTLPSDFPKDVYVAKNAKITGIFNLPEGSSVTLSVTETVALAKEAYKREMKKNGWNEEGSIEAAGQSMLSFNKNNRHSQVVILEESGETFITLIAAKNK